MSELVLTVAGSMVQLVRENEAVATVALQRQREDLTRARHLTIERCKIPGIKTIDRKRGIRLDHKRAALKIGKGLLIAVVVRRVVDEIDQLTNGVTIRANHELQALV